MPDCIPLFTSDGLDLYFYALTAHFGAWQQAVGERKRRWGVAAGLYYGQLSTIPDGYTLYSTISPASSAYAITAW